MKPTLLVVPALVLLMSACGGGEADEQVNDFTGNANSSSSCNAEFKDRQTSTTRSQAASDVQCTSYVAHADSYLESARANCVAGNKSDATRIYNEQYLPLVTYAQTNVEMLCGGDSGGGIIVDNGSGSGSGSGSGTTGDFTLYIRYSKSGEILDGTCRNYAPPPDTSSYYYYAAASHMTMDECDAKAAEYGLN